MSNRLKLGLALAFAAALPVFAVNTKFTDFTPLASSAAGLPVDGPEEATPIALGNAKWSQRTVADRRTQNTLVPNSNSGSWDMITSNETGPDRDATSSCRLRRGRQVCSASTCRILITKTAR